MNPNAKISHTPKIPRNIPQNKYDARIGKSQPARRGFLKSALSGVATGLIALPLAAQVSAPDKVLRSGQAAFKQDHKLQPLPYKASSLEGLSGRLIESHWSNNYGGSVRALNETNRRLVAALADGKVPAFTYNDLKREHLMRTGSVVLHELYFDNLGGSGVVPSNMRKMLASAFGSVDRWETEFRQIAGGLGGGSGWVMLGYNQHFGALENYWMGDHMHAPVATVPLLVIDLYEHSYQMDFGAATARYVDAFVKNINWEQVEARLQSISLLSG